jgi:hypothetical protein
MGIVGIRSGQVLAATKVFRDVATRRLGSSAFENSLEWIVA